MESLKLVDTIINMPDAKLIAERVFTVLKNEERERKEFYDKVDENMKAEFINGEMIIHSPVMLRHNFATSKLFKIIDTYADIHDLGFTGIEKIMISLTRNDYEPDICFFDKDKADNFTPTQKLFPAPDFIVEVLSTSTEAIDRGIKFRDYAAHGVTEYWIVDPDNEIVEQYKLKDGEYTQLKKSDDGTIHCVVLQGLDIPVRAIFDKKLNRDFINSVK